MADYLFILWKILLLVLFSLPFLMAIILLIRNPDAYYYTLFILLSTVTFWVGEVVFDAVFKSPLYTPESLHWVFSTIAQGYAALIGILGSFMIYHLQSIKDVTREIRRETMKLIPSFDTSKIMFNDKNYVDYLRRLAESNKQPEIKHALYSMGVLLEERRNMEYMIRHQFVLLFASVFLSIMILLIGDGYLGVYGIFFKLGVSLVVSISIAALLSTVKSIFRLTQTAKIE